MEFEYVYVPSTQLSVHVVVDGIIKMDRSLTYQSALVVISFVEYK